MDYYQPRECCEESSASSSTTDDLALVESIRFEPTLVMEPLVENVVPVQDYIYVPMSSSERAKWKGDPMRENENFENETHPKERERDEEKEKEKVN